MKRNIIFIVFIMSIFQFVDAQFTSVGSGSYRTTFPGTDAAGRNGFPSGTPQLSGKALGKPVPTNDWWSKLVKENHVDNLFTYPFTLKTINQGLIVSYIPFGVIDDMAPITVGTTALNADKATISDYSDWTATMDWNDGSHHFNTTAGIAMPFLYFNKGDGDIAQVKISSGEVTIDKEMLIINKAKNAASFAVYAPVGSTWTKNGDVYSSTLNGKNYWSLCILPLDETDVTLVANRYKAYAYVFPTDTKVKWTYNEQTSVVRTDFQISTEIKEGDKNKMLIGLLPHQWSKLTADSPVLSTYKYPSVRGQIKTIEGNSFSVQNSYHGILPTLPYLDNYSEGFDPSMLTDKVNALKNESLATWTDSYNEGQVMNRLIQTARIADEIGNTEARNTILATIKERLEDWLTAKNGEVAFLFYYNDTWSALLGYPAGHGQDTNINDHHFHWGYFIHAASFLEQYEPGWASHWGEMINMLVRDAASSDHNDKMFPFLRNFSPYAGHCWANGFASFPQGNDQESTSESMQFNSSLIHWGTITGNNAIRDLGIYLYTTEQSAIEEYWFDMNNRNFKQSQQYSLVSRVWGNSYDNGTFWTADIAASYGIEMYPIHGGSLYLGQNTDYVTKLWTEIKKNTGIMTNEANPNLWHDVMWEYLAFIDPQEAIRLYNSYPNREIKFGVSDAQTYYWLHSMNAIGSVDATITADYPIAAAFKKGGDIVYVAHNYGDQARVVTFSTGYKLNVPARSMANSKSVDVEGELRSSFNQAFTNGSVSLALDIKQGNATKVVFFDGNTNIGEVSTAPFNFEAKNLDLGTHKFYARIYASDDYNISNIVPVTVGRQLPFDGTPTAIPGTIEAGKYDEFEGGIGQDVSYYDMSPSNAGDYRKDEYVDATLDATEGAFISHNDPGEWLEYTINVVSSGMYSLACRYASGNPNGGGPIYFELDGKKIGNNILFPSTSATSWNVWATKDITNIPLIEGKHVLRLSIGSGEVNLGKMTFQRTGDLPYSQPIAKVGKNIKVLLPQTTATLNGSASYDPASKPLTYQWEQLSGPSIITFSNKQIVSPSISNLKEGVYLVKLTVNNSDLYSDSQEQYIIVSSTSNVLPTISISSPINKASYIEGTPITIVAKVNDLDGDVTTVKFYSGDQLIGTDTSAPFSFSWTGKVGTYQLTAKATDNEGGESTSSPISVTFTQAPSCEVFANNGDFSVKFSPDKSNPTMTFIPQKDNVGTPTCLLYYGTNASGPFPGMPVQANVPFRITAAEGSTVYFYYTYSTPTGEKNTANDKNSFVIGACRDSDVATDNVKPVMGAASVVSKTYNSAILTLVATDVDDDNKATDVTKFIINDATNSIVNKEVIKDVNGKYPLLGLIPSTVYNLTITAKDNAGNVSTNSTTLSFTTEDSKDFLLIDDFEGGDKGWLAVNNFAEIRENPSKESLNNSDHALYIERKAGDGTFWTGAILNPAGETNQFEYLHVKMYRNNANKPILKISDNPSFETRPMANITMVADKWQDVVFEIPVGRKVDFVFIMSDETSTPVDKQVEVFIDDIVLNNDPTPRIGNDVITDNVKPVMGAASVDSKTFNSAVLNLTATDVDGANKPTDVTTFIINDATNSIVNKEVIKDVNGKYPLLDLTPSTVYNLTITAKDNAGNVSANSTTLSFTTEVSKDFLLIDDFEGGDKGWLAVNNFAEIRENPSKESLNNSDNVLYIERKAGDGTFWTGAILNPAGETNQFEYLHVKMYRNNANKPILKISDNPSFETRPMANITMVADKWQDVVFEIPAGRKVDFVFIMSDETSTPVDKQVEVYIDDIVLNNDPTPRIGNDVITDNVKPVMGAASLDSKTFNSAVLNLTATDVDGANKPTDVTKFIINDAINSIVNKEVTKDVNGKYPLLDLTPSTVYNLTITAKDNAGNISSNSALITFTTVSVNTKPVMGAASLDSKTYNSAVLNLMATDVDDANQPTDVTKFIINDAINGIVNKEVTKDVNGKYPLQGLTPSTVYNMTITAKDNAGNISSNSASVTFTTESLNTKPVMGTASLDSKTYNSAVLNLTATDVDDANQPTDVTTFIINDATNGIENKEVNIDVNGKYPLLGLTPSSVYNLTITAKDNAGNISPNSTTLSFTTDAKNDPSDPYLIKVHNQTISIENLKNEFVSVFSLNGTIIASKKAENKIMDIPLSGGVYLLKIDNYVIKVLVK